MQTRYKVQNMQTAVQNADSCPGENKREVREGNDGKYLPKESDRERLETNQGDGPCFIFHRADLAHSFVS